MTTYEAVVWIYGDDLIEDRWDLEIADNMKGKEYTMNFPDRRALEADFATWFEMEKNNAASNTKSSRVCISVGG